MYIYIYICIYSIVGASCSERAGKTAADIAQSCDVLGLWTGGFLGVFAKSTKYILLSP